LRGTRRVGVSMEDVELVQQCVSTVLNFEALSNNCRLRWLRNMEVRDCTKFHEFQILSTKFEHESIAYRLEVSMSRQKNDEFQKSVVITRTSRVHLESYKALFTTTVSYLLDLLQPRSSRTARYNLSKHHRYRVEKVGRYG
jgi:hypothetical protein